MNATTRRPILRTATGGLAARGRIEAFAHRFGDAHLFFAYHAAFPIALTPDLAYQLWQNFPLDVQGNGLRIPWVAVADLLLSDLCQDVRQEVYEMDSDVRRTLLAELEAHPDFGMTRLNELSYFLIDYLDAAYLHGDPVSHSLEQMQRCVALAYIDPGHAADQLASALQGVGQEHASRAEQVRIAALAETISAGGRAAMEPLATYARAYRNWVRGRAQAAQEGFAKVAGGSNTVRFGTVTLPVPVAVTPPTGAPMPPAPSSLAFDIWFADLSGGAYALSVASPTGQTSASMHYMVDQDLMEAVGGALDALQSTDRRGVQESDPLQSFGAGLFSALFSAEVGKLYDECRAQLGVTAFMRLALHTLPRDLDLLPWELLYDPRSREYVCISHKVSLVRYRDAPTPPLPVSLAPPLHIAVLTSTTYSSPGEAILEELVRPWAARGLVKLTRLDWKEWPGRIAELMSDPVHVLYDAAGEVPFAMPQGETTYQAAPEGAPIQALVDQLRGTIGLVILEAPPSRGSGVWYGLSNIAQQLGSGGVPAVVVLSRFLPPDATRVFLTALFEALVWGGEVWARTWGAALTGSGPQVVDTAVAAARKALTAGPDSFAWSVAALYSSTLGGVIFVPTAAPPTGARQTGPEPPPVQVASVRVFRDKAMRRIESVAWSPTGDLLAGGAEDGTVWVWSARDGEHALTLNAHRGIVRAVAWSPDGGRLATGSDDATVRLWSMPGGTRTASLRGHTDRVDCVAFSPDGRYIATCSADHTVRLWSAAGEPLRILSGHTNAVRSLAFSADGRTLYSGSSDRTVRLWRVDDGQAIAVIQGHSGAVRAVAFAQLGAVLATGSYDQSVRLWRPDGTRLFLLGTHTGRVYSVAFTPDGGLLASGSTDQTVRLWNVADGTNLAVIRAHEGDVRGVAWSPSGGLLATGSLDGTIRLWANPGFAQSVSAS